MSWPLNQGIPVTRFVSNKCPADEHQDVRIDVGPSGVWAKCFKCGYLVEPLTENNRYILAALLRTLKPPQSVTTLLGSISNKAYTYSHLTGSINKLSRKINKLKELQDTAPTDAAWWWYNGQSCYLKCVRDLYKAAKLVKADNLPFVKPPELFNRSLDGAQHDLEKWGAAILEAARKESKGGPNGLETNPT